jgi:L-fuconate dehydratase
MIGTGFTLTLGDGNDLVCDAIRHYERGVVGMEPATLIAELGERWHQWSNDGQFRWLGPQKGVVHLALAALVAALVDLWAREMGIPLWRALLEMPAEEVTALVDFSTIDDYLSREEAIELLEGRPLRSSAIQDQLERGYPAYDTSVGWLAYDVQELVENAVAAKDRGFGAIKVKVGLPELETDVRRISAVREALGADALLMIDANQRWGSADAIRAGGALASADLFWFEEPVHPDDLSGYRAVRQALAPLAIAGGEHIPNQVLFKNFLTEGALDIAQPDVVRLGGLPEYVAVALMAAKAGVTLLPHAGDMGQIHQHLIYFSRCRLGMPELPLEMIPHLAGYFAEPCRVEGGRYRAPTVAGSSTAIRPEAVRRFAHGPLDEIAQLAERMELSCAGS